MNAIAKLILISVASISVSASGQVCAKQISVPDYSNLARAAQWVGTVNLTITIGSHGQVIHVKATGSPPMLVDEAKKNVKTWTFCEPGKGESKYADLRFEYRIEGAPVYPFPPAKVVIDLGEGTILITSPPGIPEP